MRTRKTLAAFIALAVIYIIIAVFIRSWIFLTASIACLAIIAVGIMWRAPNDFEFKVERSDYDIHIYEGDEIWIEVEITNRGERVDFLEVMDEFPVNMEMTEGTNHTVLSLEHGETGVIRYKLTCPIRGNYYLGPIHLRYREPLGFSIKESSIKEPADVNVLPEVEDLQRTKVRPGYPKNRLGNIPSGVVGIGTEFYALREYRAGDRMHDINWKATARKLEPIINDFEGEMSGDVIIIVDGFKGSKIGTVRDNTFGATVRLAATLTSSILDDRNRVGLILMGDQMSWVYPGYGRHQYYTIIDRLSRLSSGGLWQIQDIHAVLNNFFPTRCMIIFISPLVDPKIVESVYDLSRREFDVLVISPSPIVFEKHVAEVDDPLSEKIYSLRRENIINKLRDYSIVVDWNPHDPVELAMQEVNRYRYRR